MWVAVEIAINMIERFHYSIELSKLSERNNIRKHVFLVTNSWWGSRTVASKKQWLVVISQKGRDIFYS